MRQYYLLVFTLFARTKNRKDRHRRTIGRLSAKQKEAFSALRG